MVIFVMFLWLRSFVAAKTLFAIGKRNLDLVVPVIEDGREKIFWNMRMGSVFFVCVFSFGGKKFACFLEKIVGYNEQDIYIWNIHDSTALTTLIFLGINRILLFLVYGSPGTHSFFLSLFLGAFLLQH